LEVNVVSSGKVVPVSLFAPFLDFEVLASRLVDCGEQIARLDHFYIVLKEFLRLFGVS
jgi:hypothetical protein